MVWFGESLPPEALAAAVDAASSCDLLVSVGTSGVVYPAGEIPQVAARLGATVIQVNPQETPLDAFCTVNLRGPAATVLPTFVDAANIVRLNVHTTNIDILLQHFSVLTQRFAGIASPVAS